MSVLKYFKTTPGRPMGGRQALSVIFFSSNLQRDSWQKKKKKQGGLSPHQRATGACRPPQGRQGPVAHQRGDCLPALRSRMQVVR